MSDKDSGKKDGEHTKPPLRRTKPAQIEARYKEAVAHATAQGRTAGLRDALFLLGVGLGVGLASALRLAPGKCQKRPDCRRGAGHEGECETKP